MDNKASPTRAPVRLPGRKLRQASLVLPSTGERVKRDFTLRDPRLYPAYCEQDTSSTTNDERTPLLPTKAPPSSRTSTLRSTSFIDSLGTFQDLVKKTWHDSKAFWSSKIGKDVLKASIAYLLGTLCVFCTPIAAMLGTHRDANQLVANVVVWFDPARSAGSMELAWLLGLCGFLYGAAIAFSSMGLTMALASRDMLVPAHVIVVLVFCGGGLGSLAWFKQHYQHPLANTATSVTSLVIVGVLTKEGAVQSGDFSYARIVQNLKMLAIGILISTFVNLIVFPVSAARELRESLSTTTTAFGDLLGKITGSFLSGLEEDFDHPLVTESLARFNSVFHTLPTHLAEARYEHFLLGTEKEWHAESRLIDCLQKIAQDMGGLRSAAATQFALMKKKTIRRQASVLSTQYGPLRSLSRSSFGSTIRGRDDLAARMLDSIEEVSEGSSSDGDRVRSHKMTPTTSAPLRSAASMPGLPSSGGAAELFDIFMYQLGPPMKSLAYTLKEILKDLPSPIDCLSERPQYRSSLKDAITLFDTGRRAALNTVYQSKQINQNKDISRTADFEEVAASCGHFSSSLQDFAENCLDYLDILDDLEMEYERHGRRSWNWLKFWQYHRSWAKDSNATRGPAYLHQITAVTNSKTAMRQTLTHAMNNQSDDKPAFPYRLWPYLRFYRREEFRFAVKVGGGAAIYAMFSYIPATQEFYNHWKMDWGLAAYMLVCSMTVGASYGLGFSRIWGTAIGGVLSLAVWFGTAQNPFALAIIGWLVSIVSFYFAMAKDQGPMARFILLTYNLSVLYAFALQVEGTDLNLVEAHGGQQTIFQVVYHRVVAIIVGCATGAFVTRAIWPIKARKKLKYGLSLLWLRMSLMWKRAPLSLLTEGDGTDVPSYMDIREETKLRTYVDTLNTLRLSAESEFELRGPFNSDAFDRLLQSTTKMLDAFHALNVIITKDLKASPGEAAILAYCADERDQLARRISHLLSVLASSLYIEYPLNDALPNIGHTRDRFLSKIFEFRSRQNRKKESTTEAKKAVIEDADEGIDGIEDGRVEADVDVEVEEEDYEILYAYALVTAQLAQEIEVCAKEVEVLYGVLNEDVLKLQ